MSVTVFLVKTRPLLSGPESASPDGVPLPKHAPLVEEPPAHLCRPFPVIGPGGVPDWGSYSLSGGLDTAPATTVTGDPFDTDTHAHTGASCLSTDPDALPGSTEIGGSTADTRPHLHIPLKSGRSRVETCSLDAPKGRLGGPLVVSRHRAASSW